MSVELAWKSTAKSNGKLVNQKYATLFLSWMPFSTVSQELIKFKLKHFPNIDSGWLVFLSFESWLFKKTCKNNLPNILLSPHQDFKSVHLDQIGSGTSPSLTKGSRETGACRCRFSKSRPRKKGCSRIVL